MVRMGSGLFAKRLVVSVIPNVTLKVRELRVIRDAFLETRTS